MAISGDVKSLTENIEASYETRVAAVSDIVQETHQTLGNFKREREKMASDLRQSLASNRSDRIRQVQEMRAGNTKEIAELAQTITEFLEVAERERKQEFAFLLQEIKSQVADIQNDTANTLADFRGNHREMAEALRSELADFRGNHREMAEALHSELADFRNQQKEMVAALRSEFANFSRDLHKQVSGMLAAFSSDQQQARAEWENMTRVMTAKRAGKQASSAAAKKDTPTSV
ncbi:MAG: hypothetical protein M3Y39_16280 [Chloroflexota bacterium]|nr:hypothetical protein [Chloroflexota bacterium]